jgi:hypothetical protein
MNHREHVFIGIVVFAVYNFINNTFINAILHPINGASISTQWLIGGFIAVIGSTFPDIIEPAKDWTHRDKFHSKKMLRSFAGIFIVTAIIGLFSPIFYYVSCFPLGYMFHLLADSMTKAGLPEG